VTFEPQDGPVGPYASGSRGDSFAAVEPPPQDPKVRGWFEDDELETCPRCKKKTALKASGGGWVICTECGVVDVRPDASS
jgi:hypothetical protein